jgi:hypothetical protein
MELIVTKKAKINGPIDIFTKNSPWDQVPRSYLREKIYGIWPHGFIREKKFIIPGPRDFFTEKNYWDHNYMENS